MPIEALQCSGCGAPLPIEEGRRFYVCGNCGRHCKITEDSSDNVTVTAENIEAIREESANVTAAGVALEHLEPKIIEKQYRLNQIEESMRRLENSELLRPPAKVPQPKVAKKHPLRNLVLGAVSLAVAQVLWVNCSTALRVSSELGIAFLLFSIVGW